MVKQHLQVYVRPRPLSQDEKHNRLNWVLTDNKIGVEVNKNKLSYAKEYQQFQFSRICQQNITQEQIFDTIAKPVIDNCLDGYNGTIFTYGQTGSGKTYTMSGGDTWKERGITPRVLSYIFKQFAKRQKEYSYQLKVSFIEIYNENAYDLLDQRHAQSGFQSWSKIVFMEDEDSNIQMKNMENHICNNQKEGIDYLMMGNYIKKISNNNLNQVSSRSHCIFTLNIRGTNLATLNEVFSKLHLVDLAGSERISKSQAEGVLLTEAKSINLSLTYLEQVIVSLNQKVKPKGKVHIPYRNSLLTTLLKDSLGGNCKTVMVATISLCAQNLEESLSTLRFAQRVKMIENEISKNEMNIYSDKIQQLEKENQLMKKKIALYEKGEKKGQKQNINLKCENQDQIKKRIEEFMSEKRASLEIKSVEEAQYYFEKIRECYTKRMRQYVSQLTFISQKLVKYDQIISKRQAKRKINHDSFHIE